MSLFFARFLFCNKGQCIKTFHMSVSLFFFRVNWGWISTVLCLQAVGDPAVRSVGGWAVVREWTPGGGHPQQLRLEPAVLRRQPHLRHRGGGAGTRDTVSHPFFCIEIANKNGHWLCLPVFCTKYILFSFVSVRHKHVRVLKYPWLRTRAADGGRLYDWLVSVSIFF